MSREAIELLVGRAVVDREFRVHLLETPALVAERYELNEFERRLLARIRAVSLEEFARQLEILLSFESLPKHRQGTVERADRRGRRASA